MKKYTAKPITAARSKADELREGSFFPSPRETTNYILELLDNGIVDGDSLARDLLEWMSEDEVTEFAQVYGYEHPEPEDDEYDEIEESASVECARKIHVTAISEGDEIADDSDSDFYTIRKISKGSNGALIVDFEEGCRSYYDSSDEVYIKE